MTSSFNSWDGLQILLVLYLSACQHQATNSLNMNTSEALPVREPVSSEEEVWSLYYETEDGPVGYRDKTGAIRIPAQYEIGFTRGDMKNIVAVGKVIDGHFKSYYRTKYQELLPHKPYWFDNTPDCEHEDHIRFRSPDGKYVGLLHGRKDAVVSIPAEYDWLTKVYNGYVVGLKGATKYCLHGSGRGSQETPLEKCEHTAFKGGTWRLLNSRGNKLLEDIDQQLFQFIDFYSLPPAEYFDSTVTLVTYEQVLKAYLHEVSSKTFLQALEDGLYVNGEFQQIQADALDVHMLWIEKFMLEYQNNSQDFAIYTEGLNPYIHEDSRLSKYYDLCGDARDKEFPILSIMDRIPIEGSQRRLEFLRTDEGLKILGYHE